MIRCGLRLIPSQAAHRRFVSLLLALASVSAALGYQPSAGNFNRREPLDVRLVSWNVQGNWATADAPTAAFRRVMTTLQPDVVVLQEINPSTPNADITAVINAAVPLPEGQSWQLFRGLVAGVQTVILSRHPLQATRNDTIPASSTRGVTMGIVNLPDPRYPRDIYIMGVHLKCCNSEGTEDASRQRSADAMAAWIGDARLPGGRITLAPNTPVVVLGDFNFVGGPQPERTLRTGDIIDEATFGPDVKGDWDNTDLTDVTPRNPFNNNANTWPAGNNPTSRLDRFYIQDSVTEIPTTFILNTASMNASQLAAAGLQAGDTSSAVADHLPIVLDIRFRGANATVTISETTVSCSDAFTIVVEDPDLAQWSFPIPVQVSAPDGSWVDLEAQPVGGGTFSVVVDPAAFDGRYADGQTVTARYVDLLDVNGRQTLRTSTRTVQCVRDGSGWLVY